MKGRKRGEQFGASLENNLSPLTWISHPRSNVFIIAFKKRSFANLNVGLNVFYYWFNYYCKLMFFFFFQKIMHNFIQKLYKIINNDHHIQIKRAIYKITQSLGLITSDNWVVLLKICSDTFVWLHQKLN